MPVLLSTDDRLRASITEGVEQGNWDYLESAVAMTCAEESRIVLGVSCQGSLALGMLHSQFRDRSTIRELSLQVREGLVHLLCIGFLMLFGRAWGWERDSFDEQTAPCGVEIEMVWVPRARIDEEGLQFIGDGSAFVDTAFRWPLRSVKSVDH